MTITVMTLKFFQFVGLRSDKVRSSTRVVQKLILPKLSKKN